MPGPIQDPTLGHLHWDKEFNWWTGEAELEPGQKVGLTIEADPAAADPTTVLVQARGWVDRVREKEDEYARWTAEQVLATRWNKDQPMTLDDVHGLLEPAAIECYPDGTASVTWDDEDTLFFGHGLVTYLDAAGACARVEVQ